MQVVKIHPSSSMADKKVPVIIYNELVGAVFLFSLPLLTDFVAGVYEPDLRPRGVVHPEELLCDSRRV